MKKEIISFENTETFSLFLLLSIWVIFIFNGIFSLPLMPPDEPKYAFAAEQMLRSGDFITPTFNCQVRFDKPPLIYWLISLSYSIFGVSDWAARLPSIAASLGVILIIYRFSREQWNRTVAVLGSAVFSSTLHVWVMSRAVAPEMVLVFFESLSIYLLWTGVNRKSRVRIVGAYASMALGFLTKGPLGVLIPLMVCGIYFTYRDGIIRTIKGLFDPYGIVLFCLIGLPWYIVMIKIHGYRYFREFFLYHNLYRFTGKARQHPFAFYYYLPIYFGALYIWLPFSGGVLKIIRDGFKSRTAELLLFVWMFSVLLFFSISVNKLHNYILIAYPPVAILTGLAIVRGLPSRRLVMSGFMIMALVELAAIAISPFLIDDLHPFLPLGGILTLVLTVLITVNAGNSSRFIPLILIKALSLLLLVNFFMTTYENRVRPGEFYVMLETIYGEEKTPLFFYKTTSEDLVFYAHRCISVLRSREEVEKELHNTNELLLLVSEKDLGDLEGFNLQEKIPFFDLSNRRRFILELEKNKKPG
jgi:4-amino-4-deoxy-L-arabinose transferase-like glycosyltransferase